MKRSFGLAAMLPGFLSLNANAIVESYVEPKNIGLLDVIIAPLNVNTPTYLAGHRSHQSHSSHGSHRSSAGGGYSVPSKPAKPAFPLSDPLGRPSSPPTTTPKSSPSTTTSKTISGSEMLEQRELVVRKVQAMLTVHGYYSGKIDGILGEQTRTAISSYRRDTGLSGGSKIDSGLLNSLGILAP
ncbi:His-Xaa-Ser repeat protein HxsA [Marinomonas sp.]|jgi:His-Xaa-Ser repeat protein HxsA|uniref:Peptidoglycan-binding domain 1 protein n=1 Tax=Marinomonas sp. (strain MWYL1) TaxID=400668 RepID=A6VXJ2_MARMS